MRRSCLLPRPLRVPRLESRGGDGGKRGLQLGIQRAVGWVRGHRRGSRRRGGGIGGTGAMQQRGFGVHLRRPANQKRHELRDGGVRPYP